MSAVAKVLFNPRNTDFNKDLPRNFKAVDVLQQYRLFFRIENDSVVGDQVIFFVWINNEENNRNRRRRRSLAEKEITHDFFHIRPSLRTREYYPILCATFLVGRRNE
jgi:hypothetical protein